MHFKNGRSLLIKCAFILICFIEDAPFHIENHRENKEKQTADHEGSHENQYIPKGMCIPHFLSWMSKYSSFPNTEVRFQILLPVASLVGEIVTMFDKSQTYELVVIFNCKLKS